MVNKVMNIANQHNQDSVAEALVIRRLIDEVIIQVTLNKVVAYQEIKTAFK